MQHICLLYARNSGKHFKCFISFNAHDKPIAVSVFQMELNRDYKHLAQNADGTKIQSRADGPDSRVQFLTIVFYC